MDGLAALLGSGVVPVTAPGAGAGVAPGMEPSEFKREPPEPEELVGSAARRCTRRDDSSVKASTASEDRPRGRVVMIMVVAEMRVV